MKTVCADLKYLTGHLRYGHIELPMDEKEYKEYESCTDKEKYIIENGDLIIDDYEVNDYGPISNIRVYNN